MNTDGDSVKDLSSVEDSRFYKKCLKYFNIRSHNESEYSYHIHRTINKRHSKRHESNLISGYASAKCCASERLIGTSVNQAIEKPRPDTEECCNKCGWKILYVEGYKMTEKGWGATEYYYHTWCHE